MSAAAIHNISYRSVTMSSIYVIVVQIAYAYSLARTFADRIHIVNYGNR